MEKVSTRLTLDKHGIWTHAQRRELSYPESGHGQYFLLEDASFWFAHRNRCILAAMQRFPPGGQVLDVGGGNGYVAKGMIEAGYSAALLEPGPVGAYNGKTQRGISEVFCTTLEDSGFPPESINAIGCFDVIEHIADDSALLAQFQEILRPGGLIYGTVPGYPWLWSSSDVSAGHFRRYTKAALRKLLEPKLEVLYFTPFFSALILPVLLTKTLPYKLGLGGNVISLQSEHGVGGASTMAARILTGLLTREIKIISAGKSLTMGTSCLFVARKRG